MSQFHSKLAVSNSHDRPLIVAIEPWAADFTLLPGESLELMAEGSSSAPWFHVVDWGHTLQVFCEDSGDFTVTQNGIRLECGHNRQPD